jgi:hypothetical protein
VCDATKRDYAPETFDVVYSRDTILHINDKRSLFTAFLVSVVLLFFTSLLAQLLTSVLPSVLVMLTLN